MEDRELIGANNPPDMVSTVLETMQDISNWMSENPVIQDMETARSAKVFIDRGKLAIKDLEDERDGKVRPLNEKVKEVNAYYRNPRDALSRVLSELSRRASDFIREEERKREAAAREAVRIAQEAEQKAREAERLEREALESAKAGELGIDIATHTVVADEAFMEFEKADRAAAIAERDSHVKIAGGFSRAISLRQKETLNVVDANAALVELGLTEDIREAILKSARAYRKLRGKLPAGITVEITEEL